jgi:molybdate transport system ATP-binding protein
MTIAARFRIARDAFTLDVDLALPSRGVSAILGPSGSGKTTLLRAMAGLERTIEGSVTVDGHCWQDASRFVPPHRRAVGYVFQEPSLFPHLPARQNIEYGLKRVPVESRRIAVADVVAMLGIGPLLDRRPDQLSGGEQQRVAIARALASSPQVLLMDEPLASLDAARRGELMPWLESLHRDLEIPVLYVTHSAEEALRLGDHMVVLENGRVRAEGPPAELAARLDLPAGQEIDPPSVIAGIVRSVDGEFGLATVAFAGGAMIVPAQHLETGSGVRLLIRASDVSLTLDPPSRTSILNVLRGTVVEVADRSSAQVAVRIRIGQTDLVAKLTRKSAAMLQLARGIEVHVQIKSVAVLD